MANQLITKALNLAKKAHAGQTDKAGNDYFEHHILHLFNAVGGYEAEPIEKAIVAILHDVVEDSEVTVEEIEREFGKTVADAVDALSKTEATQKYDLDYIYTVKSNPLAREVKKEDLRHNMNLGRLPAITESDRERVAIYEEYFEILKGK